LRFCNSSKALAIDSARRRRCLDVLWPDQSGLRLMHPRQMRELADQPTSSRGQNPDVGKNANAAGTVRDRDSRPELLALFQALPDRAAERKQPPFDNDRHLTGVANRFAPIVVNARAPLDPAVEFVDLGLILLGFVL
jgi:hypothetical protein